MVADFELADIPVLDFNVWCCLICHHLVCYRAQHRKHCSHREASDGQA
jgi:hypothetical protein